MTPEQKLEQEIEVAVHEYLRRSEEVARVAMARAFGKVAIHPGAKPTASGRSKRAAPAVVRTRAELEALESKFYAAVVAHPGETMQVLAQKVGATPAELSQPATKLRRQNRIRNVGKRQLTRYFPTADTDSPLRITN